ncbi:MAG: hypothetical protein R3A44_35100 [Caldilineaceae bacterium]
MPSLRLGKRKRTRTPRQLAQRRTRYAAPTARWADLWRGDTRSLLNQNRGQNQPAIQGIDRLLARFDAIRNDNTQRAEQQTVLESLDQSLERWLRDYDGARRDAAEDLHDAVRAQLALRTDAIQPDPAVAELANNSYLKYTQLIDRRRDHQRIAPNDHNFPFPEIADTLANMQAHIDDIKRRVVYGQEDPPNQDSGRVQIHANVSARLKAEILEGPTLDKLSRDMEALKARGYPYKETLLLINKFMKMVDYITFRAKSQPELESPAYQTELRANNIDLKQIRPGRGAYGDVFTRVLNHRRNDKFGTDASMTSAIPFYKEQVTLEDIYNGAYNSDPNSTDVNVGGTGIYRFEQSSIPGDPTQKDRVAWLIDNPEIILFPSYQPLDEKFFVQIRGVPVYMVGMLNIEYLNADNIRQSPAGFFEHDLFHIIGFTDQDKQQFDTLKEHAAAWQADGYSEEDVFNFWSRNWQNLETRIEQIGDPILKDALYKVLFMAIHEPIANHSPPSVLETDALTARITPPVFLQALTRRIERGEFGAVDPAVVARLPHARDWLMGHVGELFLNEPTRDHV